ncbi:TonB-dependent receptor plug domain-containing protein [Rhizorhabdus histidinilytica]
MRAGSIPTKRCGDCSGDRRSWWSRRGASSSFLDNAPSATTDRHKGRNTSPTTPQGDRGRRPNRWRATRTSDHRHRQQYPRPGSDRPPARARPHRNRSIGLWHRRRTGGGAATDFGGTATEDSLSTGSDRSFPNTGFGSGANLRGLGSDATLVLVNGRRMAGSGGKGDFTDLSSIPVGSIARIEILADGASAIYGSDAVGGVINMILKKDFEGAETRARFGSATSGSLRDYQFSQLAGTRWSTGHIMASYEYSKRAALPSADRRFTRSADLRPLGGDDFRNSYSIPATVLRFDPGLGTYVPGFAVPDGQDGTGLTLAPSRRVAISTICGPGPTSCHARVAISAMSMPSRKRAGRSRCSPRVATPIAASFCAVRPISASSR